MAKIRVPNTHFDERYIEHILVNNPSLFGENLLGNRFVKRWIGRQYHLPSGIADLIGVSSWGNPVVVEIKNVPINKAAVLQVCRYASDLESIVLSIGCGTKCEDWFKGPQVIKYLVGPSIDEQTLLEAGSCGVKAFLFEMATEIELLPIEREHEDFRQDWCEIERISERTEWDFVRKHFEERRIAQGNKAANDMIDAIEEELRGRSEDDEQ